MGLETKTKTWHKVLVVVVSFTITYTMFYLIMNWPKSSAKDDALTLFFYAKSGAYTRGYIQGVYPGND